MPSGDFNRSIERERERGRERRRNERVRGKTELTSTPVAGATGSQRCDGKIQVYFFFFFLVIFPK